MTLGNSKNSDGNKNDILSLENQCEVVTIKETSLFLFWETVWSNVYRNRSFQGKLYENKRSLPDCSLTLKQNA